MMLNKAKVGDAIRFNNTVYVKQANGMWKSPFEVCFESSLINKIAGNRVDYLFSEEKVEKKAEKVVVNDEKVESSDEVLLEIKPKEIKNVQEGKKKYK